MRMYPSKKPRFLVLLLILFCGSFNAFSNIAQEIPFQLLPSGHLLVTAKVNGIEGKFIFDTGAGLNLFTKKFLDKVPGVVQEDGGFTGFRATGERLDVNLVKVSNFELGIYKQAILEASFLDVDLSGFDGILSLKLFETQPFTIDFDKTVIRLENTATVNALKKGGSIIPLQIEQNRDKALDIFAYFKVNDALTLQFSLDSGAGRDVYRINSKYAQKLGIDLNDTIAVKRYSKKSEFNEGFASYIYVTTINKIAAAASPSVSVSNLKAQLIDGLIYDGIIWINWLGKKITIDLPGKQLIVHQ